jgi:hypothetical protein
MVTPFFLFFRKNKIRHGYKNEYSSHIPYIRSANMKIIHKKNISKVTAHHRINEASLFSDHYKKVVRFP